MGVAYWLPNLQKVSSSVLLDCDMLDVTGKERETRLGIKMLIAF